ncbi:transglutaminase family protein [Paracoccus sp. Z330]|uniref:Transglutaminase family protein n=1 Tax=Paracoccus onchidii TaxID=3017813 RepID=A0ABT4ZID4_9RHOB|nr:transglutaminase family protein [Paracoccus onchidii]MDB6179122.1 transglutaminase family protein [Paracoccus onchidii]
MYLNIHHETRYRFETGVQYGLQQLRMTPKSSHQQQVVAWQTRVVGGVNELHFEDHHHNTVELISFASATEELVLIGEGQVRITDTNGIVGRHRGPAPLWLYEQITPRTRADAGVRDLLRELPKGDALDRLHNLSQLIREQIAFEVGVSCTDWGAEEVIAAGKGVCQDHTHVFLACARKMGFPARYVSGYLMLNDRSSQVAMHAWAEVHLDGLGWVGFDISNGISPDTRYVRVATGLDYRDAAPVSGSRIGGMGETLSVSIDVVQQ